MVRTASHLVSWPDWSLHRSQAARQRTPRSTVFLRSGDTLHLACAEEYGFQEVYTNDRHMLKAARHFHLTGMNVISEKG
jgi:predicted nucleic acid-binding protein